MGNASAKNARRLSTSTGSNSKRVHWGGPGVPAPPGKPVLIPGSSDDAQPDIVAIRWERSPSNGGAPIIGYLVEHRRMGSPHWVRSSPNLCPFPELTLSGLEPGWRYQFRVRAQNSLGISQPSELSDPLTVTLQRSAATIPHFELELKDTTALENEQVEFVVKFSGLPIPKISWFKDSFEIFSSRRTRIVTENGKSTLLIHQTALNDEGEIKCTATNRAGHISTRAKLILEAAPRIRLPRQYEDGLLFEQDEAIRLKVSIAGKPVPNVTWLHDGEVIKPDDRHIIDAADSGECSMRIPAARRKDRGEYTVKAVNKLGEDIVSFLVTVTDRPSAPGKAKIAMTLGRSVTLSWSEPEDDGGCKIGTYIIEYYRIGWDVWLKAATCRQPTTTLSELIEGSEYKFRVKAENPYGVSDPSEESDVIFIPDPKRGIHAPPLRPDKSQSQREIHRGRTERRDQSEPAKRTRSLTREEAIRDSHANEFQTPPSRSASAHKLVLGPPPKPPRADSRVTFSDTVFLHLEKPLEDDDAPVAPARPRTKRDKIQHSPPEDEIKERHQTIIVPEKKPSPPVLTRQATIDSFERPYVLPIEKSPSPLPPIQTHKIEENRMNKSTRPVLPREATEDEDDTKFRGSSEIMLVLYPDEETGKRNPLARSASDGEADAEENDEDLLPPPMSLSLPELFSANHQVVEILREAVSSTELLHERAMERFYKAVAVEEAEAAKKSDSVVDKPKEGLDFISGRLRSTRLKRRLSSGSPTQGKNKWTRRRSSEGQTSPQLRGLPPSLMLPAPQIIASDPNLHEDPALEEPREVLQPASPTLAGLHHWDDKNMPLVPEHHAEEYILEPSEESFTRIEYRRDVKTPDREIAYDSIVADDYEESTDAESEPESDSSEDLRTLKSRILAQPIMDEEDTYHPRGRPILYVPPPDPEYRVVQDTPVQPRPFYNVSPNNNTTNNNSNNIQPKSILKKRTEEDPVPLNSFGRPIPPEKPIVDRQKNSGEEKKEAPVEPPVTLRKKSTADLSDGGVTNTPVMSELDSDNASLLNAAEVAKNRRRSNQKPVIEKKSSAEEKEELEGRQAVVDHYMEIVREYSLSHAVHPVTRYTSNTSNGAMTNNNNKNNNINDNNNNNNKQNNKVDFGLIPSSTDQTKQMENISMKKEEEIGGGRRRNNNLIVNSSISSSIPSGTSVQENLRSSRRISRNETPIPRSRNVSGERRNVSRSSSKTRMSEVAKEPGGTSRSSSRTRKREISRDREAGSRSSSKQRGEMRKISSRNSSRERFRAVDVSPSDSETSQRVLQSVGKKINRERPEKFRRNSRSYERPDKGNLESSGAVISERLMAEAHLNVRSSVSYVIDLIILMAAIYLYLFKNELFAIPFIFLLIYRQVEEDIRGWIPKWWKAKPRDN